MRVGNGGFVRPALYCDAVHPHACGERLSSFDPPNAKGDSSPCVWGTVISPSICVKTERFIPMRVGNGLGIKMGLKGFQVHPHACGERSKGDCEPVLSNGSSPCVWGTAEGRPKDLALARFIPMRVGNGNANFVVTSM